MNQRLFFRVSLVRCFLAACIAAGGHSVICSAQVTPAGSTASYAIGVGDTLSVHASNVPELVDKPIRVDLNGLINLPLVGKVHAGGLSVDALQAEISQRLKVYLEEPDVTVAIAEYQSQPVSVFGEVVLPGVHQLQGHKSLVEILAVSGGARPTAGPIVRITRRLEYGRIPLPEAADDRTGRFSIASVELKPLVNARTPQYDIAIEPYDTISIPKAEFIYVAGDVVHAGTLPLTEKSSMSVMEAVTSSGGTTKTSNAKRGRILRATAPTAIRPQEQIDVQKIMTGKAEDIQLMAGDILVIPSSNTRKATQRALELAIQIGTLILSAGIVNGSL